MDGSKADNMEKVAINMLGKLLLGAGLLGGGAYAMRNRWSGGGGDSKQLFMPAAQPSYSGVDALNNLPIVNNLPSRLHDDEIVQQLNTLYSVLQ